MTNLDFSRYAAEINPEPTQMQQESASIGDALRLLMQAVASALSYRTWRLHQSLSKLAGSLFWAWAIAGFGWGGFAGFAAVMLW